MGRAVAGDKWLMLACLLVLGQSAEAQSEQRSEHTLPLVTAASNHAQQGFVRIINHSGRAGTVEIHAIDDSGDRFGPVSLDLAGNASVHFNSADLESGNDAKRLSGGIGDGEGDWRVELSTTLDIEPLAYVRTADGFVTGMHDLVVEGGSLHHHVPIFNPGSNRSQVSRLRLINPSGTDARVEIYGLDDEGARSGDVDLTVPAGGARTVSAQELESGGSGLSGVLGDGAGKWHLFVSADRPIQLVNLLRSPTEHLANLSTSTDAHRFGDTRAVSAGAYHTCAVRGTGAVACWGNDRYGQATPPSGTFVSVSAAEYYTCGIRDTGAVVCWGETVYGEVTSPEGTFVSVSAGSWLTCGIRDIGAVACWPISGDDLLPKDTPPSGTFVSVSAGGTHTCGIRDSGTVACWGHDESGQATPPTGQFVSVSAGYGHTCGVRDTGTMACWGHDGSGQATPPTGQFVSVSAGGNHTCGIRDTGAVACWGWDGKGQATPPGGTFVSLTAGPSHTCGIRDSGAVACWGAVNWEGLPRTEDAVDPAAEPLATSPGSLTPEQRFISSVTVNNQGAARSAATTLRYYRSTDATISASDTAAGTDAVGARLIRHQSVTAQSEPRFEHTLPLVTAASNRAQQGFVRIINHSGRAGSVEIHAIDDSGDRFGPISLDLAGKASVHFNSADLESGNDAKRLSGGVGDGEGDWRVELSTTLDIEPLAYVRTADGFVTGMHDLVVEGGSLHHHVPILNPGSNRSQVSRLRLINPSGTDARVEIYGLDDEGERSGDVDLTVPAGGARTVTAQELESGGSGLSGVLGDGSGKWHLFVSADRPIQLVNLLRSPTEHLANLSTSTDAHRFGDARTVNAGVNHTCIVRGTGTVACWGDDRYGQARPPSGTFVSVGAGAYHTCGIRGTGAVACWGYGGHGQTTPPTGKFVSVSAGNIHNCGIRDTGTVVCWGFDGDDQATPPAGQFVSVSAGSRHTCGIRDTGAVACWGLDRFDQATPLTGRFVSVSAEGFRTCGIRDTGAVACWGLDEFGEATPPGGTFVSVSAGGRHTCGIRDSGAVACWGFDGFGEATPPSGTFVSVSAGALWHTCGIRDAGAVTCWGAVKQKAPSIW